MTIQDPQLSSVERRNMKARCAASRVWADLPAIRFTLLQGIYKDRGLVFLAAPGRVPHEADFL